MSRDDTRQAVRVVGSTTLPQYLLFHVTEEKSWRPVVKQKFIALSSGSLIRMDYAIADGPSSSCSNGPYRPQHLGDAAYNLKH
jgi:hypothetical protein